jgi:hypothetical protein
MANESVVKRPGLNGFVLPYGFVQSPILASLALDKSKLGSCLRRLNSREDLKISVYVDDIIISGNDEYALLDAADQLGRAAKAALFPINSLKNEGPASSIVAFNITLSHKILQITEERLTKLRTNYHETTSLYCKAGISSYIKSINSDQGREF